MLEKSFLRAPPPTLPPRFHSDYAFPATLGAVVALTSAYSTGPKVGLFQAASSLQFIGAGHHGRCLASVLVGMISSLIVNEAHDFDKLANPCVCVRTLHWEAAPNQRLGSSFLQSSIFARTSDVSFNKTKTVFFNFAGRHLYRGHIFSFLRSANIWPDHW
jgi:hypothetical protein